MYISSFFFFFGGAACVILLYSVQLGGQRNPLSTTSCRVLVFQHTADDNESPGREKKKVINRSLLLCVHKIRHWRGLRKRKPDPYMDPVKGTSLTFLCAGNPRAAPFQPHCRITCLRYDPVLANSPQNIDRPAQPNPRSSLSDICVILL